MKHSFVKMEGIGIGIVYSILIYINKNTIGKQNTPLPFEIPTCYLVTTVGLISSQYFVFNPQKTAAVRSPPKRNLREFSTRRRNRATEIEKIQRNAKFFSFAKRFKIAEKRVHWWRFWKSLRVEFVFQNFHYYDLVRQARRLRFRASFRFSRITKGQHYYPLPSKGPF